MEHVGLAYASLNTKPHWHLEQISNLVAYCGSPRAYHLEFPRATLEQEYKTVIFTNS